jgi:hypothetical protein
MSGKWPFSSRAQKILLLLSLKGRWNGLQNFCPFGTGNYARKRTKNKDEEPEEEEVEGQEVEKKQEQKEEEEKEEEQEEEEEE